MLENEHLDRIAAALEALATHLEHVADALDDILLEAQKDD